MTSRKASAMICDSPYLAKLQERFVSPMPRVNRNLEPAAAQSLPALRFEISEAKEILRISRAQLYKRIQCGALKVQKDGTRTFITRAELERYVESCNVDEPL